MEFNARQTCRPVSYVKTQAGRAAAEPFVQQLFAEYVLRCERNPTMPHHEFYEQYRSRVDALESLFSGIQRLSVRLRRLGEDACNGHPANSSPSIPIAALNRLQEEWESRVQKQTKSTEELIHNAIAYLAHRLSTPITYDIQGDPRGAPLRVETMGRTIYFG